MKLEEIDTDTTLEQIESIIEAGSFLAFSISEYRELCEHFEQLLSLELRENELYGGFGDSKNLS